MASNSNSNSKPRPPPRRPILVERRPPMLKDFLLDPPPPLQRSRSRSREAADATLSALQKLLNAVRASLPLPSVAVKSSRKKRSSTQTAVVRVKDILRWKSFRDGSDGVTAGVGEVAVKSGSVGGEDPMRVDGRLCSHVGPTLTTVTVTMEDDDDDEDEEQQSPVSVLESPILFRDQEESSVSSFDQSLANVERKRERLLETIKWFESLASGLDPTNLDDRPVLEDLTEEDDDDDEEEEERITTRLCCCHNHVELGSTKAFPSTHKLLNCIEEVGECVRDMDKETRWSEFEEQRTQLSSELEMGILNALLDELLFEIVGGSDSESTVYVN